MAIALKDLTIPLRSLEPERLLTAWEWGVTPGMRPVLVSLFGDVFLQDERGRVHWINTVEGQIAKVAGNGDSFKEALRDRKQRALWLMPELVLQLRKRGIKLGPGQCYAFRTPPFLGGAVVVENIGAADLYAHLRETGRLAAQVAERPPGTRSL
jgi:hypothetical protein